MVVFSLPPLPNDGLQPGVNTHVAPIQLESAAPCTRAVLPSPDNATDQPCCGAPDAPLANSRAVPAVHRRMYILVYTEACFGENSNSDASAMGQ